MIFLFLQAHYSLFTETEEKYGRHLTGGWTFLEFVGLGLRPQGLYIIFPLIDVFLFRHYIFDQKK
jgi:hypothetical protein